MSIGNFINEETIQTKLAKDIRYIRNDLITQIKDNKDEYCKFSRPLNAICILSFTKDNYIKYWTQAYMRHSKEKQQIIEACEEKLKNGLTDKQEMIKLVEKSNDRTEDKAVILATLKGLPKPKQLTQKQLKREAQFNEYIKFFNQ